MSDMVKYRAVIWSFLKLTAQYFTMFDIVHMILIVTAFIVKNGHIW